MRYLPHSNAERADMLAVIGASTAEDLFSAVPRSALLTKPVDLPNHSPEFLVEAHMKALAGKNHAAAGDIDAARGDAARCRALPQQLQPSRVRRRFQHQLQRAAAGQAEARRLFFGHAIGQHFGSCAGTQAGAYALDQIRFDAAARYRADDGAVVAQHRPSARRPRRRSPRARHGRQRHPPPGAEPGDGGIEHCDVFAVHQARRKGNWRKRRPLAANSALATAGAITGTPGSPTPVGISVEGTICTSMRGISPMRSSG